jgi:type I restriction enzyme R subunit
MSNGYTEDHLVEQPAVQLMQHELGWDVVNCYDEWSGGVSNQGRDGKREVVLVSRLRPVLQRLNPDLPVEAIEGAVEEICRDRTALSLAEANREIDKLLWPSGLVLFATEQDRLFNRLKMNEFLFE